MSVNVEQPRLAATVESVLAGLRWRIRSYVWLEGVAVAVAWLGLTFWVLLAIDYGPVLLGKVLGGAIPMLAGLPEAAWSIRAVMLLLVVAGLAGVVYRWLVRRAFVPLGDTSMALLLERRFQQFHDSLVTSVEMAHQPDHASAFNPDMLAHTSHDALAHVGEVRLSQVFNFAPLALSSVAAGVLAVTIGLLAVLDGEVFGRGLGRLYLLSAKPYDRSARVEVLGIEVERSDAAGDSAPLSRLIPFGERPVKVAKGSSAVLKVQADANLRIPDVCTVLYSTGEGESGRQNMKKIGRPRNGFQQYSCDTKPFRGILSNIRFDVVGFDHRVGNYEVEVVDSPAVVGVELIYDVPDYLKDAESGSWPKRRPWTSGAKLPRGTRLTIHARANKPLAQAYVAYAQGGKPQSLVVEPAAESPDQFEFAVPPLDQDLALEITLDDTDGVVSETPQRIYITAVPDEAPHVKVALRGIGTAVTPDVRVPLAGEIQDDYAVAQSWLEVQAPGVDTLEHPLTLHKTGALEEGTAIDFRAIRNDKEKGFGLTPGEKNKLVLTAKASDRFNLTGQPNIGSGDRYELDIVTADDLLALLEREEAGLRRRVEQIYEEMTDARDWLLRVKNEGAGDTDTGTEPEDKPAADTAAPASEPGDEKAEAARTAERVHALRMLFAQRSLLQTRKSKEEVLGSAESFRDIREQLINNRVDAEDRKSRLKDEVADPLQRIGEQMFTDLDKQIETLETKLKALGPRLANQPAQAEVAAAADLAVQQADDVLAELEKVLQKLIKYETYAELLDIVRDIIKDQEGVIDETKTEQKKDLLKE